MSVKYRQAPALSCIKESLVWCTTAQVKKITGADLDDIATDPDTDVTTSATLDIAVGIIELKTGLLQDAIPDVAGRDGLYLMRAVAYQAAWVQDQPDLFTRLDVSSTGQDGQSANFKAGALYLAPLAKMALKRLSWKGTHSTSASTPAALTDSDDGLAWRPL